MPGHAKKLKVAQFICSSGFYGAERWILALCNHFDHDQLDCELIVTREPGCGDLEIASAYRDQCHRLGEVFELPMSNRFDLRVVNKLARLIEDKGIDVLHTHGYKSDIIGVLAARKSGIRCVVTPHGFENTSDIKLRLFIWLGCQSMRFADRVAPLSTQILEDVKRFGIKPERLAYIQNGVDLSEIDRVREDSSYPANSTPVKRIGYIGQLIGRKNIGEAIESFQQLRSAHAETELVLIGDGEEREQLQAQAQAMNLGDSVRFLGYKDNRLEYLKSFDLFVMTSSLEGIPRCMMEAMAMGVPVAAYDIPGVDQLISHEQTGMLAPFGDKSQLAGHWEKLLFDEDFSNRIRDNALQHVQQQFSAQRMADEYLDLFREMLG